MKKRFFTLLVATLVTLALPAAERTDGASGVERGSSFQPMLLPAQPLAAGSTRNGVVPCAAGGDIAIDIDPDQDDADTILLMLTFGVGAAALASMLIFMASR